MAWRNHRRLHQAAIVSAALGLTSPASAHGWYPKECCNEDDCLPAESFNGRDVTAIDTDGKRYTISAPKAFPVGLSRDGRVHVCFSRPDRDVYRDVPAPGSEVIEPILVCLFVPPTS